MRTAAWTAAAVSTALAAAVLTLHRSRRTIRTTNPLHDTAEPTGRWGDLPCPPLREGVGHLHDWLASGDWTQVTDVLDALREQAPAYLLSDLVRDLQTDLRAADQTALANQLYEAEQMLRQAAAILGEVDYNSDDSPYPDEQHSVDCLGGCGGTGELMETMTWDDQGDGIYVPVHQEPVDCPGDADYPPHDEDCDCGGTGFTYEPGYRNRCPGRLYGARLLPTPDNYPWGSTPQPTVDDRPF